MPWQQYEFDGDLDLLRRHYDVMKHYVAYLGSRATNHIVNYGLGDWYDIGPKTARRGAAHAHCADRHGVLLLRHLDSCADARVCWAKPMTRNNLQNSGRTNPRRVQREILQPRPTASTPPARNRANAIPLVMGLCEPPTAPPCWTPSCATCARTATRSPPGDVGYRYLLRALADGGRSDVIFDMNNQSDKPGYGYQLKNGATSLTEAWDARRSSSQNHFMLGQIQEWFYHDLAGIGCDPAGPGFKKIIIHPQPVGDVTWAKASYDSIRGKITSDWQRAGGKFTLRITIPANTTATVFIPAASADTVTESGKPAAESGGVKFLGMETTARSLKFNPAFLRSGQDSQIAPHPLRECPADSPLR